MKTGSVCFSRHLAAAVLGLLVVPIAFVAQGWSFGLYEIGFVLIWPLMILQIIVGNSGPAPSCRTLARVALAVVVAIAILVTGAIYVTPALV